MTKVDLLVSSDPQQHINGLKQDIELGFNEIILHNVNREQKLFIQVFGKEVIPVLNSLKDS